MAALVYHLRLTTYGKEVGSITNEEYRLTRVDYEDFRRRLIVELTEAQASQELRPRKALDTILSAFVLKVQQEWEVINLNWDSVIDERIIDISGCSRDKILHLHGDISKESLLYLPTEISMDSFREEDEIEQLMLLHERAVQLVEGSNKIILYGVSVSPLDAELATILMMGFMKPPQKEIIIINPDHKEVAELVKGLKPDDSGSYFVQSIIGIDPDKMLAS